MRKPNIKNNSSIDVKATESSSINNTNTKDSLTINNSKRTRIRGKREQPTHKHSIKGTAQRVTLANPKTKGGKPSAEQVSLLFAKNNGLELGENLLNPKLKFKRTAERKDLTQLFTFTIDSDHSMDLDDAISIKLLPNGAMKLFIHISDVAESIPLNSEVDLQARARGTSIYLPGLVLPMFNFTLSHDSLSLLPGKNRFALTLESDIDAEGKVIRSNIYQSRVKSNIRLDYSQISNIVTGFDALPEGMPLKYKSTVVKSIQALHLLSQRIGQQRIIRGGVNFEQFFTSATVNPVNELIGHEIIERVMVLANEQAALWLEERNSPAVYRAHPSFLPQDIKSLSKLAEQNGVLLHLPDVITPVVFAALLAQIKDHEAEQTLLRYIQKIINKAFYTYERSSHFGLGSSGYLHFTSPIRRYSDLVNHRLIKSILKEGHNEVSDTSVLVERENITVDNGLLESLNNLSLQAVKYEKEANNSLLLSEVDVPSKVFAAQFIYESKNGSYFRTDFSKVLARVTPKNSINFTKKYGKLRRGSSYNFTLVELDYVNNIFDLDFA